MGSVPYSDPSLGGIARIRRRQEIDFDLVDSTPDPTIAPNDYTDYNQQAAIDAVVADILSDPLPQKRDSLAPRDIYNTAPGGYSSIVVSSSVALSAPLNCNGADTFIESKLFTSGPFDETLCAAACTAQSAYNLKHPPSSGFPKLCQFYNTYVLLKDGVSQGQYCHGVCGPPDDLKIDRRQTGWKLHAAGDQRRSDCIGGGQYILAYPQTGSSIASSYGWELDHEACELVTVDRDGIVPVSIDDGQDGRTLLSQYQKQCPNTEGDIDELVAAIDASTLEDDTGKKRPEPVPTPSHE
ncbi:hypothetical protein KCU73_g9405, partial [Aureobasidium melanogenum]